MKKDNYKEREENLSKFKKNFLYNGILMSDNEKKKLSSNLEGLYNETPVLSSFISPETNEIYCKLPDVNLNYLNEKKIKLSNFQINGSRFGNYISICINQLQKDNEGFLLDLIGVIFVPAQNIIFDNLKPNLIKFNIVNYSKSYKTFLYKNDDQDLIKLYSKCFDLKEKENLYSGSELLMKTASIQEFKSEYQRMTRSPEYALLYPFIRSGILDDIFYIWDDHDPDYTIKKIESFELSDDYKNFCKFYVKGDFLSIIDYFKSILPYPGKVLEYLGQRRKFKSICKDQNISMKTDKKFIDGFTIDGTFILTTLVLFHSKNGHVCPSIDSSTGEIHQSEVDTWSFKDTEEKQDATGDHITEQYWHAFSDNINPFDIHHVLEPSTVFANQFDIEDSGFENDNSKRLFDNISLEGDLDEATKMVDDIINEASNNKIWTIPYKAKVEIQFGSFTSLVISEFKNNIYFLLNNSNGRSFYGFFNVDEKKWDLSMTDFLPSSNSKEDNDRIRIALKLLISSIVRDFWIVEVRESIFNYERRNIKRKIRGQKFTQESIKYIPRVKYIRKIGVKKLETDLNYNERRSHWVVAHLRRIEGKSSDTAIALAKNYGFEIKENFTFVKPHERGGLKGTNVKYRSKSALKLLFQENVTISPGEQTPEWFKFEVDVNKWLMRNKFETVHTGGSGDGGKDIIATKIIDKELKTFLFECKCWKDKIGINILRKLVGTLTDYPPNTIGGVITTSAFTKDAIEYAERKSIILIDGQKLISLNFLN